MVEKQLAAPPDPRMFSCPVCSFAGPASVQYDFKDHQIYACPLCRLMFLHPQPTEEELKDLYSTTEYYRHDDFFAGDNQFIYGYPDYFAERMNKQREYSIIARKSANMLSLGREGRQHRRPTLLEVGCGPGYFLSEARKSGFEVEGIEFNQAIIDRVQGRYDFCIRQMDYIKQPHQGEEYDCIVMFDVLEHFTDPFAAVEKAYQSLAPGGLLIISTVDSGSVTSRLLGKRLEDFRRVREHLYFFNRNNIKQLLRHYGFHVSKEESIGHTFIVGHLLARITLMSPSPRRLSRLARRLFDRLAEKTVTINPRTKMIVYATKPSVSFNQAVSQNIQDDLNSMKSFEAYYDYLASRVAGFVSGKRVIEMGCGTGNAMRALIGQGARKIIGVDRDAGSLEMAARYLDARGYSSKVGFRAMDVGACPDALKELVEKEKVEVVFSFNFLEHLTDDMRLIKSVYERLEPGGLLISVVPAGGLLFNRLDEAYHHVRRYDEHDIDIRFQPFECLAKYRLGFFKGLGWLVAGRKHYQGLGQSLNTYNRIFRLDKLLDSVFFKKVPLGGSWVCVHRKN